MSDVTRDRIVFAFWLIVVIASLILPFVVGGLFARFDILG